MVSACLSRIDPLNADSADAARFEVSPDSPFIDEEIRIRVSGLTANSEVGVRASTIDDDGREWASHAAYRADFKGSIDLAAQAPVSGDYRGVSAMGLFWSMKLASEHANGRTTFAKNSVSPIIVHLQATASGESAASENLTRRFIAPGTTTRDLKIPNPIRNPEFAAPPSTDVLDAVENESTVGRLFIPPGAGPHPVVIVLSGSGGGFDIDKAALLSRHGFATFALSYFGTPPLPWWLNRIPLEYFEAALGWLGDQPEIDPSRIGIFAISRGAELALLLAATIPHKIRAVVACAPSSVAWAAGGKDKSTGKIVPSWTYREQPLPFAPLPLKSFMWRSAFPVAVLKRPVKFVNLFRAALGNRRAVEKAAIPVEKIQAPILLVSGGDDHLWPASEMAEALVQRARQQGNKMSIEHLHYPNAGHMLRYPYLPTTSRYSRNPHLRNARFSFGGSAEADAAAQEDYWGRAISFLRANL